MSTPSQPQPDDLSLGEVIGGPLIMGMGDELALGDAGDYGDELAMGEADESEGIALTFGVQESDATGTGAWRLDDLDGFGDLADIQVNEVKGDFSGDGSSARDDVMVMEDEWDEDAEIIAAVWQGPDGRMKLERRVRRSRGPNPTLIPYGVIAVGLLGLGGLAMVGVLLVVAFALLAPAPEATVAPLDKDALPQVEVDHERVERAKQMTSEEILQEVLGEDGAE